MITINTFEPTTTTFPDQEINVSFLQALIDSLPNNEKINIVWKYENNEEIFKLGIILDLLNTYLENRAQVIKVIIPFLPYSRMDRHEPGYHNPLSIGVLQTILKAYKKSSINPIQYQTYDVHNVSALDNTLIKNIDIMPDRIQNWLTDQQVDSEKTLLIFPDKGSFNRYNTPKMKQLLSKENFEMAIGDKVRDFKTHKITRYQLKSLSNDEVNTSNIDQALIIDDVISYGGTFIKLTESLHELNINNVHLLTSHAEDALWRGDLLSPSNNVFVTTSDSLNHHLSDSRVTIKPLF